MTEITIRQLKAIVLELYKQRQLGKVSLYVTGPPGIGKTALFEQIAAEIHAHYRVFLAARFDPTDVTGVPSVEDNFTHFRPPARLMSLTQCFENPRPTVAVFDDLPTCHEQVFCALQGLFHERCVGEEPLRDNVLLCATGNRLSDNAGAKELPTALANRFVHFDLRVSLDEWIDWAISADIEPLMIAFHRSSGGRFLHDFKPNEVRFPSPRSNEMASFMYKTLADPELQRIALEGCCGESWAQAFFAFSRFKEALVPTEEIFKDPAGARIPSDIDVLHAVMANLASSLAQALKVQAPSDEVEIEMTSAILGYALRFSHRDMAVRLLHDVLRLIVNRTDIYAACASLLEEADARLGHLIVA